MIRINVFVEGQTEETFVRDVLAPHYARLTIFMNPILAITSPGHKGGIVNYAKIHHQITRLCRHDTSAYVTTMIDMYGLPGDFPGKGAADFPLRDSCFVQAAFLETKMAESIAEANFIPNLQVHEYEALLFCQPVKFGEWIHESTNVQALQAVANSFETPEHINDNPQTAPSKRIAAIEPRYKKTLHGPLIAGDIGLDVLRQKCEHFNQWLNNIENLKK